MEWHPLVPSLGVACFLGYPEIHVEGGPEASMEPETSMEYRSEAPSSSTSTAMETAPDAVVAPVAGAAVGSMTSTDGDSSLREETAPAAPISRLLHRQAAVSPGRADEGKAALEADAASSTLPRTGDKRPRETEDSIFAAKVPRQSPPAEPPVQAPATEPSDAASTPTDVAAAPHALQQREEGGGETKEGGIEGGQGEDGEPGLDDPMMFFAADGGPDSGDEA